MSDEEKQNEDESVQIDEEHAKETRVKEIEERIQQVKADKRCAKSRMTKLLNNLAAIVSETHCEQSEIRDLLFAIEQQKEETLAIMEVLEKLYREKKDQQNALKVSDEADLLVEQVERETSSTRMLLISMAKSQPIVSNPVVTKQVSKEQEWKGKAKEKVELKARKRKEQLKSEALEQQEQQLRAAKEEEEKCPHSISEESESEESDREVNNESEKVQTVETQFKQVPLKESKSLLSQQTKNISSVTMATRPQAQLERIKIPDFSGNKMEFQRWYAAFTSCVDMTSLTPQFKMLRLEACLKGEAAETIKGLGYSAEAYEAAKARLVRKYGGSRRQVQSHLEEFKRLKPVEENNAKELEKFADILERAVITLKENGCESDLESGTLYTIILEKIPGQLLAQYYRWLKENQCKDNLESLKDWVAEEAEFQIQATEIKQGILPDAGSKRYLVPRRPKVFFGKDSSRQEHDPCSACSGNHPIWKCAMFQSKSVEERWKIAKREGLCYRCLAKNHLGSSCPRSRQCNINGCRDSHNRLLHGQGKPNPAPKSQESNSPSEKSAVDHIPESRSTTQAPSEKSSYVMEGDGQVQRTSLETIADHNTRVALRTIPIILKNGERKIHVNCLLDEGSDTTYVQ